MICVAHGVACDLYERQIRVNTWNEGFEEADIVREGEVITGSELNNEASVLREVFLSF